MKILKYVVGAVVLLGGIFILLGVFTPTVEFSNEVEVNKSLEESWAVSQDESKMKDWLPFIKSQKLLKGEKGKTGAVTKMVIDAEGEEMEMIETLTAVKENEHMGMQFEADAMSQNLDMHFSEKDGKTVISSKALIKGKGMMFKSMFALMQGGMKKENMKVLVALKETIEKNTKDYFPEPVLISEDASTVDESN